MAISLASIKTMTMAPPALVLYGMEGIGKSTLASCAPNPVFIAPEDPGIPGIKALIPKTYEEVLESIGALYNEKHDFLTVVIDTATRIEPLLWNYVVRTVPNEKGTTMRDIKNYGFNAGYDHAVSELGNFLAGLDALRFDRGMGVIVLGHVETERVESPESEGYDRYRIKMHKKAAAALCEWSTATMLVLPKASVIAAGETKSGDERKRAIGDGTSVVYTTHRPSRQAKNRYHLPEEIPVKRGEPDAAWAVIQSAIDKMSSDTAAIAQRREQPV